MSKENYPIEPQNIIDSASYIQIMFNYASGAALPLLQTAENTELLNQYKSLVTRYGEYAQTALLDEKVAALLLGNRDKLYIISSPENPDEHDLNLLYESVLVERGKDAPEIHLRLNLKTGYFKENNLPLIVNRAYPANNKANNWKVSTDDPYQKYRFTTAFRHFEPTDLVSQPQLVAPFVRGITAVFAQAQQAIIGNKEFGQTSAEERVKSVVNAFTQANQVLNTVFCPSQKK